MTDPEPTDEELMRLAEVLDGRRDAADPVVADLLARRPELVDELAWAQSLARDLDRAGEIARADIAASASEANLTERQRRAFDDAVRAELPAAPARTVPTARRPTWALAAAAIVIAGLAWWAFGGVTDGGTSEDEPILSDSPGFAPAGVVTAIDSFTWPVRAQSGDVFRVRVFASAEAHAASEPPLLESPELEGQAWRPPASERARLESLAAFWWQLVRERADGTDRVEGHASVTR